MNAERYNPVSVLVRLLGVAAICALGYVAYRLFLSFPSYSMGGFYWEISIFLIFLMVIMGVAFFAYTAVRSPSRTHLVTALVIGGIILGTESNFYLAQGLALFLTEHALIPVGFMSGWLIFILTAIFILTLEWKLSKAAHFVTKDDMWWCESNIRGCCILFAWFLYLFGFAPILSSDFFHSSFQSQFDSVDIEGIAFLLSLGFCVLIGKALPPALMKLTGVVPAPPVPRRRRKGFHLFSSTEPVPTPTTDTTQSVSQS